MAARRSKASADDGLNELFEGIDESVVKKPASKSKPAPSKTRGEKLKKDIPGLAELEDELGEEPARPHTPRVKETSTKAPVKRTSTATPPPGAPRQSEDKPANVARKSVDSTRSLHASFTPSATSSDLQDAEKKGSAEETAPAADGGWWGGLFATASATANAAMKQAEAAYKEIQQNEEAKKWADQVKGNVGALRGLGDGIRQHALPTFANILHTLAPPISSHERLLIHITHDIVGYPSLDPLIHEVFSRVMSQVEGGDLLVIQRGHENTARRSSDAFYKSSSNSAGWRDGPWWRQVDSPRDLGAVKGIIEGTKLCRVSAESYSHDYFAASGGVSEAQKRALEPVSEENPVRTSDIFLAVQPIVVDADTALFAGSTAGEAEKEPSAVADDSSADPHICFAVYVLDPIHDIVYSTVSQYIPAKWIRWLDAPAPLTPASGESEQQLGLEGINVPDEIREIVESGGVDPREWVAEWVEETLSLSIGVVAQRYVARRMGVGEGGLGKGKQKVEELLREGGGEAARAGLI
ncbi:maintenance of telomere capping protein 1 [Daldinia loculata]|uniref:maintenance of telomere capping protein 1 n=1 Tax=Daldinia loculata TaxID=103429 RepID=UPI0020C1DE5E|nr:maintenance of telomere capping protein 1 [Daldinia loculata]KAI1644449.1 maintenance of telomere capping protein 1 [Daldinia loculata]